MGSIGPLLGFLTSNDSKIVYVRSPSGSAAPSDSTSKGAGKRAEDLYDTLFGEHRALEAAHRTLKDTHASLDCSYTALGEEAAELRKEKAALTSALEGRNVALASLEDTVRQLGEDNTTLVSEGSAYKTEIAALRRQTDPHLAEWEQILRINEALGLVELLLQGRDIDTVYQEASLTQDQYVLSHLATDDRERVERVGGIPALLEQAAVEFSATEWSAQNSERREQAQHAQQYFAQLSQCIEEKSGVVKITDVEKVRAMGLPIMAAGVLYHGAKKTAAEADNILEEFRTNELAHIQLQSTAGKVQALSTQYDEVCSLPEKIRLTIGNDASVPMHVQLAGQTANEYVFLGVLPVPRGTEETPFYRSLQLCLLSAALESGRFPGIRFAGQQNEKYITYQFGVSKVKVPTPRDVALLLYDLGETMTTLEKELPFGKVGVRLAINLKFNAGAIPVLEDIVSSDAGVRGGQVDAESGDAEALIEIGPVSVEVSERPIVRSREDLYRAFYSLIDEDPSRPLTKALVLERFDVHNQSLVDPMPQYIAQIKQGRAPTREELAARVSQVDSATVPKQTSSCVMNYETYLKDQDNRAVDVGLSLGSVDAYQIATRGVNPASVERTHLAVREILLAMAEKGAVRSKALAPHVKEKMWLNFGIPVSEDSREKAIYATRMYQCFSRLVEGGFLSTVEPFGVPNNCYMLGDRSLVGRGALDATVRERLFFFGSDRPHAYHVARRAVQYQRLGVDINPLLTFAGEGDVPSLRRTSTLDHYVVLGLIDASDMSPQDQMFKTVRGVLPSVQDTDVYGSIDRLRNHVGHDIALRGLLDPKLRRVA